MKKFQEKKFENMMESDDEIGIIADIHGTILALLIFLKQTGIIEGIDEKSPLIYVDAKENKRVDIEYLRSKDEDTVKTNHNMLLFGNPNTNFLLDKYRTKDYDNSKATLSVEDDNLIIIVN